MKKLLLGLLVIAVSTKISAHDNELGFIVGSMEGFSYKKIINENFAIQTDLAVGFQKTLTSWYLSSDFDRYSNGTHFYLGDMTVDLLDFGLKINFLYNRDLGNNLYAFIGGGTNLGLAVTRNLSTNPNDYPPYGNWEDLYDDYLPYTSNNLGKFGLNTMMGAGYKLLKLPLTFSLDFRPGFAILFNSFANIYIFDWHLAVSARYCFDSKNQRKRIEKKQQKAPYPQDIQLQEKKDVIVPNSKNYNNWQSTDATNPKIVSNSSFTRKTQQLEQLAPIHDAIIRSHMGEKVYRKYLTLYQEYINNEEVVQEFGRIQEVVLNYLQTHLPKELDKTLNDAKTYDEILSVFKYFAK